MYHAKVHIYQALMYKRIVKYVLLVLTCLAAHHGSQRMNPTPRSMGFCVVHLDHILCA